MTTAISGVVWYSMHTVCPQSFVFLELHLTNNLKKETVKKRYKLFLLLLTQAPR
jgi:hypothetical protein